MFRFHRKSSWHSTLDETPINSGQIEKWTSANPVPSHVRRFVEQGWSDQTPPEFDCYRHRKDELSVQQGVLFWGAIVIIPPKGRDALPRELHDTPGIVKMKALTRSYLLHVARLQRMLNYIANSHRYRHYKNTPMGVAWSYLASDSHRLFWTV